ncbi:MAG: response regulator, partial [Limisphaerales bacterium]
TDLLSQRGHHVTVAENGKVAVDAYAQEDYDLILMDIHMPFMDGFDATAAIREQELASDSHIPIIALTANAMKGDRERCLEAGMDGYLAKPIRAHDLFLVVEQSGGTMDLSANAKRKKLSDTTASVDVELEDAPVPREVTYAREEPVIDPDIALQHVEGQEDILQELVGIFFEECDDMIGRLASGIAAQDAELVERSAHTLKSSSAMFGANRARAAAFELELTGKSGNLRAASELFEQLKHEIEVLRVAVNERWGNNAK